MFHSEENIPYPCGTDVFFITQCGISRGQVKGIQISIDANEVKRNWIIKEPIIDGENMHILTLDKLAVSIEHAVAVAAKNLPAFEGVENVVKD